MTVSTDTPRHESPAKLDRLKKSVASIREAAKQTLGGIMDRLAECEHEAGAVLIEVLATYPDTASGRKGFYKWASLACGGRKEGMIRRWMTAAKVLDRVPDFKSVSTKLDTLQFVSGLPDAEIVAVVEALKGEPSTEAQVVKAALKVSDTAKKREKKRQEREGAAAASTREKNNAASEQFIGKWFAGYADDRNTLAVMIEEGKIEEALTIAYLRGAGYGVKSGVAVRVITAMQKKFEAGDHLASDESDS